MSANGNNANNGEPLVRQMTVWGVWALVVNGMIGAGIFAVPAGAAALTGVYSPLVFLACAALLGLIMVCFAEISSYFRHTGGPVAYVGEAFGRFAGFQTGLAVYATRVTAFAANINLLVASLAFFWVDAAEGPVRIALIAAIIGGLAFINIIGVKRAMQAVSLLTILKFLPLIALVLFGLAWLSPEALPGPGAPLPGAGEWGAAMLLVIYAFVGWESALVPAGEARNPQRDMRAGLFWGLGVVTVLYVAIQMVSMAVLPDLAESERALVDVAAVLFGPAGALLLTVGVIVSVGGNIAGTVFTAPRLTYAMAREDSLPAWFAFVHPRHKTPMVSILVFAALGFALALYGSFFWLAAMSAFVRVLVYMACILAMPRLRKRFGGEAGSFRAPLGWTVPVLAVGGSLVLLSNVPLNSMLITAGFLAFGAVLYWLMRRVRPGARQM
ncbi:MAG: APC family permease [Maricaulaceae bacterium]|nr:APC family permease [Maricaulaceae bacterium]